MVSIFQTDQINNVKHIKWKLFQLEFVPDSQQIKVLHSRQVIQYSDIKNERGNQLDNSFAFLEKFNIDSLRIILIHK